MLRRVLSRIRRPWTAHSSSDRCAVSLTDSTRRWYFEEGGTSAQLELLSDLDDISEAANDTDESDSPVVSVSSKHRRRSMESYILYYASNRQYSAIRRIYEKMIFSQQPISLVIHNHAILAYTFLKLPDKAERAYDRLLSNGYAPDARTFLSLLVFYSRTNRIQAFSSLYRYSREVFGLQNPEFHLPAIYLFHSVHSDSDLHETLQWMESRHLAIRPWGLEVVLRSFARNMLFQKSIETFQRHGTLSDAFWDSIPYYFNALLRTRDYSSLHSHIQTCLENSLFHPLFFRPFFVSCAEGATLARLDAYCIKYMDLRTSSVLEFCYIFPFLVLTFARCGHNDKARAIIARRKSLEKPLSVDSITALAILDPSEYPEALRLLATFQSNTSKRSAILFKESLHRLLASGQVEAIHRLYQSLRSTHGPLFMRDRTLFQCVVKRPDLDWDTPLKDFQATFRSPSRINNQIILYQAARACCRFGWMEECFFYWINSFRGLKPVRLRQTSELEGLYRRLTEFGDASLLNDVCYCLNRCLMYFPLDYCPTFERQLREATPPTALKGPLARWPALYPILFGEDPESGSTDPDPGSCSALLRLFL